MVKYQRKSIRLPNYDYSHDGHYFVTICVKDRKNYFGDIVNGQMSPNDIGKIVNECWNDVVQQFDDVRLGEYVIMPNHIHGIIKINKKKRRGLIHQTQNISHCNIIQWGLMKNPKQTLGKIIRYFKAKCARSIHKNGNFDFQWQRNYYEHIIRDEKDFNRIHEYIKSNPANWDDDENNPAKHEKSRKTDDL